MWIALLILSLAYMLGNIFIKLDKDDSKFSSYIGLGLYLILAVVVISIIWRINS